MAAPRIIEEATGVRRGTASAYLTTDPGPLRAGLPAWPPPPSRAPTASACEPFRELIELARGRNAMAIWRVASVSLTVHTLRLTRPTRAFVHS